MLNKKVLKTALLGMAMASPLMINNANKVHADSIQTNIRWQANSLSTVQQELRNQNINLDKPITNAKYIVQSGDTLSQIAAATHIDMYHIAAVNHINNLNLIYVGQVLLLNQGNEVATNVQGNGHATAMHVGNTYTLRTPSHSQQVLNNLTHNTNRNGLSSNMTTYPATVNNVATNKPVNTPVAGATTQVKPTANSNTGATQEKPVTPVQPSTSGTQTGSQTPVTPARPSTSTGTASQNKPATSGSTTTSQAKPVTPVQPSTSGTQTGSQVPTKPVQPNVPSKPATSGTQGTSQAPTKPSTSTGATSQGTPATSGSSATSQVKPVTPNVPSKPTASGTQGTSQVPVKPVQPTTPSGSQSGSSATSQEKPVTPAQPSTSGSQTASSATSQAKPVTPATSSSSQGGSSATSQAKPTTSSSSQTASQAKPSTSSSSSATSQAKPVTPEKPATPEKTVDGYTLENMPLSVFNDKKNLQAINNTFSGSDIENYFNNHIGKGNMTWEQAQQAQQEGKITSNILAWNGQMLPTKLSENMTQNNGTLANAMYNWQGNLPTSYLNGKNEMTEINNKYGSMQGDTLNNEQAIALSQYMITLLNSYSSGHGTTNELQEMANKRAENITEFSHNGWQQVGSQSEVLAELGNINNKSMFDILANGAWGMHQWIYDDGNSNWEHRELLKGCNNWAFAVKVLNNGDVILIGEGMN